ncbi:MAG: NAD(P)H-quinone oxidoreductase [Rickettsiales bacterium]
MFKRKKAELGQPESVMRAVAIEGGKLVPTRMAAKPVAGTGEILVKVAFVGVNRADILQREGKYPPPEGASKLPGLEVSGTIEEIGDGVVGWSVGEEVCALLSGGGYAEYVSVPAAQVLSVPSRVSLKEAASLPEAAATAVMALLLEGRLQPRERVLLHGGTSGTGLMIAQVARALGNPVFATAGGPEKVAFLKEHGIHGIDYRAKPFAGQIMQLTQNEGVDVIIDILGAPQVETHLGLLRRGGRLISLAMLEGNALESLKISRMLTHNLHWCGTTLRARNAEQKAEIVAKLRKTVWPQLTIGSIRPVIDSVFPLEAAEKAHARMESRLHMGKILLEVAQGTGPRV